MVRIFSILCALFIGFNVQAEPNYKHFISFDGLKIRTAQWQAPSKKKNGTIILLQGMAGYIEGDQDFISMLVKEGYDVLTFDWRGQGGSQRVTDKKTLLHVPDFTSYIKDLETFFSSNQNFSHPLILMGNSMGGHLALRYAHDHPNQIDAVVAFAPMLEIKTSPYPYQVAKAITSLYVAIGWEEKFVFGYEQFSYSKCVANYSPLKYGDKERYLRDCEQFKKNPDLAVGGPSFAWLKAAFTSCEELQSTKYASEISVPTLMISVPTDHIVSPEAQRNVCGKMPRCHFKNFEDSHHSIVRETNEVMGRFIEDLNQFRTNYLINQKSRSTPSQVAYNAN